MKYTKMLYAAGLAAALLTSVATVSAAQTPTDTTHRTKVRSQTRIPVSKEAPGEVVADTASPPPPPPPEVPVVPPPPAPVVAVTPAPIATPRPLPLYFLLGAGTMLNTSADQNDWNEAFCIPGNGDPVSSAHRNGFNALIGGGYDAPFSPLGVRADLAYNRYTSYSNNDPSGVYNFSSQPELWLGNLDLKLRAPFMGYFPAKFSVYALGGGTYARYKVTNVQNGPMDPTTFQAVSSGRNAWGWNAGGGAEYSFGHAGLFAEARHFWFQGDQRALNTTPISVGLRFF